MNPYVNNAKIAMPNVASKSVGTQNKDILKILFPIRLAAKNNAKNRTARIHSIGEWMAAAKTPIPTAFCSLIPLNSGQKNTTHARNIAANMLRRILT